MSDGCTSPACQQQLGASSSLSQGTSFANMTKAFHGGKSSRRHRMRGGGGAEFPSAFDALLPSNMHSAANIGSLDTAFAQLPQFAGKYGMSGGRRSSRSSRRSHMRGGMAPIDAPAMLLSAGEERSAFLNPQWYTENQVVPSFKGPENAYVQKAGKRKASRNSRKSRKASRKNRKASRKDRKASRKNRCSRKNRK